MNRRMHIALLMLAVLTLAQPVLAQRGPLPGPMARGRGALPGFRMLPSEERQRVYDWTKEKMPNLAKLAWERGPRIMLQNVALNHYRQAQEFADTDLQDRVLANFKLEDAVFGHVIELENATPEQKPAVREKIRVATREMVEAFFKERQDRIDRMKTRVAEEEKRLAEDKKNVEQIVANRLSQRYLNEGPATRPGTDAADSDALTAPPPQQ